MGVGRQSDCTVVDEYAVPVIKRATQPTVTSAATAAVIHDVRLVEYEHNVIAYWKAERWTKRNSWVSITQLLKNVGYTREAGTDILFRYSEKHYAGATSYEQEELWDSMHEPRADKPISFGTGIHWLHEDNPQAYARYRTSLVWAEYNNAECESADKNSPIHSSCSWMATLAVQNYLLKHTRAIWLLQQD